jgi:hypothetical protein
VKGQAAAFARDAGFERSSQDIVTRTVGLQEDLARPAPRGPDQLSLYERTVQSHDLGHSFGWRGRPGQAGAVEVDDHNLHRFGRLPHQQILDVQVPVPCTQVVEPSERPAGGRGCGLDPFACGSRRQEGSCIGSPFFVNGREGGDPPGSAPAFGDDECGCRNWRSLVV